MRPFKNKLKMKGSICKYKQMPAGKRRDVFLYLYFERRVDDDEAAGCVVTTTVLPKMAVFPQHDLY